ncbi:CcdC protein domain-containing protein [Novosphingobium sp.]|uniref:CcdC protein domain-containing protein n=1 Tax=Novosphingobium sp. TaxID=1874826 RepID=UPI00286C24D4|nr:CcdC protein domain-containing protein [Novosphingobium sp.]
MDMKNLQGWLPLLIIAVVFAFRFRGLSKPKPFRPGQLWIAPLILTAVFTLLVVSLPPSAMGWLVIAFGLVIGGALGWKRGHLLHLERDPESGAVMMRQSPAALLLVLGIIFARRSLSAGLGLDAGAAPGGVPSAAAMLLTDGLLGFALGMVVAMRWTLWQRFKALPTHQPEGI